MKVHNLFICFYVIKTTSKLNFYFLLKTLLIFLQFVEKCWYYDLCIVVHLETGLTVEPFSACTKFLQEEGLEVSIRDPDAKRQLIVCIWLW